MINLFANDKTRMVEAEKSDGKKLPDMTAEQAIAANEAGDVEDMSIKTQRLIYDFEGDWDELSYFYAECDA